MPKFRIFNPDLSKEQRTYISADYSSGTSVTVRNNTNFTANRYAVAGEPAQEQTETGLISSLTNKDTIVLSAALNFSHPKSTVLYESRWKQWAVERSTSKTGTFAPITSSPDSNEFFDMEWEKQDNATIIDDDAGSSTSWYRWRPYNVATATYGSYSDPFPAAGLDRNTVGSLIQDVLRNPLIDHVEEESILYYFNDFQDFVYERIPSAWWFHKEGDAVATAASDYTYSISTNWSDYVSMLYLRYRYDTDGTDQTYLLSWQPLDVFYNLKSDSGEAEDDVARFWTLLPPDSDSAKGYIGIHPTPSTTDNELKPVFNFAPSDLDTFGDEIVIPKPKGYVDYALMRIFEDILNDDANAEKYRQRVNASIVSLRKRSKRQTGQTLLTRYKGQRGFSKQFGGFEGTSPDWREQFWGAP